MHKVCFLSLQRIAKPCQKPRITLSSARCLVTEVNVKRQGNILEATANDGTVKKKVLVTRRLPRPAYEIIRTNFNLVEWDSELQPIPRDVLLEKIKGVHGLYTLLTESIDKELLDAAGPQLEVVSTMSVGYDHIELAEIKKRGIKLGNTADEITEAVVAECTMALLLMTTRRLHEAVMEAKQGNWGPWSPLWMCGRGLYKSIVGIVGLGQLGQHLARRLAPFGVTRILYSDIKPRPEEASSIGAEYVDFKTLVSSSDFIIPCVNLTEETKEMFNKNVFQQMKHTSVLINASRGAVVNQYDLYKALKSGQIRAAGLDVTVPEPLPPTDKLYTLNNCVILPHVGSAEIACRIDMAVLAAQNLVAGLQGEPMPSPVNL